jgi:hypothetical protein
VDREIGVWQGHDGERGGRKGFDLSNVDTSPSICPIPHSAYVRGKVCAERVCGQMNTLFWKLPLAVPSRKRLSGNLCPSVHLSR